MESNDELDNIIKGIKDSGMEQVDSLKSVVETYTKYLTPEQKKELDEHITDLDVTEIKDIANNALNDALGQLKDILK